MTIRDYQETLKEHAPCAEGAAALAGCKTRKEVFELIGSPLAADYLLSSIEEGWGPTPEDVMSVFRPYVNGGLTVTNKVGERKIRSQVWCMADEVEVKDNIRWVILIGCRGTVKVGPWQVVKILMDSSSRITIEGAPSSLVFIESYGGEIRSAENCNIAKIIKK